MSTIDPLRAWLWCEPTTSPPEAPRGVLYEIEVDHCSEIRQELRHVHAQVERQHPKGPMVYPRREDLPSPCTISDLLALRRRVVVVGGRSSGKTALIGYLAVDALAREPRSIPFVIPVQLLPQPLLNERTIAEVCPRGAIRFLRETIARGRALILVDGLDEAGAEARRLSESIEQFAEAHPEARIVVTTRPRRTGIPGFARVDIAGFTTAALLPPQGSRVYPAHRFLARRTPEQRGALVAADVEARLLASVPANPAEDAVLPRFSLDDQRALWSCLAHEMHWRRVSEITEDGLQAWLEERLGGARCVGGRLLLDRTDEIDEAVDRRRIKAFARLGEPASGLRELAARVVQEIKERPGLLVSPAPGVFRFADLILQEYLVALDSIRIDCADELIENRQDPWWHEALVLAVSIPALDAARFVEDLLETERAILPTATLLAMRCMDAAPERIPEPLKRTIRRRVSALVPPDSDVQASFLIDQGDIVIPALLKTLATADVIQRACSTIVLGASDDRSATPELLRMISDRTRVEGVHLARLWIKDVLFVDQPISAYAMAALINRAIRSAAGRASFEQALERIDAVSLMRVYEVVDRAYLLQDDPDRDAEVVYALLDRMEQRLEKLAARKRPTQPGRR
ncbi:MAG: hypothetical protein IT372_34080 [Polyangiaceae bacterium]|nr:hypothetical protein [Polyangiaceae bacterium]